MTDKPFIPWLGGKRRLAKHILPLLPAHRCYTEPFAGGGAIFFMKEQSKVEVLNDVNDELVTLYRVVQNHLEEFVRHFKWALTSRKIYDWMQMTEPDTLTDIQRAARFFYLQKLAFGGKVSGQNFGTAPSSPPRLNLLRIEEDLSLAHLRLARTYIEHLDWRACVNKYDRPYTLHYLDPPYWETAGYGGEFELDQYQEMADLAGRAKGRMIISVNDHPEMRRVFKGLSRKTIPINYTVGGSNRAGGTRKELLIRNWKGGKNAL